MTIMALVKLVEQARTPRVRRNKLMQAERMITSMRGVDLTDALAMVRAMIAGTMSYSDHRLGLLAAISGKMAEVTDSDDDLAIIALLAA